MKRGLCSLAAAMLLCGVCAAEPIQWLTPEDADTLVVVQGETAALAEAAGLFETAWKKLTGYDAAAAEEPSGAVRVWIGSIGVPTSLLKGIDLAALGTEGIYIRTVGNGPRRLLLLGGNNPRSCKYAVYEFFERYCGVRWLPENTVDIPESFEGIPAIDFTHVPPFKRRSIGDIPGLSPDAARIARDFQYGIGGHSLYNLLQPDLYFEEHPEYYSELDGKRQAPVGLGADTRWGPPIAEILKEKDLPKSQLCMTNPDVAETLAREIGKRIEQNPAPKVWSVSQNDWDGYCECDECTRINEQEGSIVGSFLVGVNRVAEIIEREHPGYFIHTYAYRYTQPAPKTIRPRDNVIVELCSYECDFAKPYTEPDSLMNGAYYEDFMAWKDIAPNLICYDYGNNYRVYQCPFPNFEALAKNIRFYAENNIRGIHWCARRGREVAFGYMRPYVIARLMWDPTQELDAVVRDFAEHWYGAAAPYICEYVALLNEAARRPDTVADINDSAAWLDYDLAMRIEDIFQKALAAAETPETKKRVELDYLQSMYASMIARPKMIYEGEGIEQGKAPAHAVAMRPPCPTIEEYIDFAKSCNTRYHLGINKPLDKGLAKEFPEGLPLRETQSPVVVLENEAQSLWTLPAMSGTVIRWRDTQRDNEWLRGYEWSPARPGTWQDWINTPMEVERPVAQMYEVVDETDDTLTIEAQSVSGLRVRRTTTLLPGRPGVQIELQVSNPTDAPLDVAVKPHPEFSLATAAKPEIWIQKDGLWVEDTGNPSRTAYADGRYLDAAGHTAMAFWSPEDERGMLVRFEPDQLGGLLWFYNCSPEALHVNLELLPGVQELKPGETRIITAVYEPIAQPLGHAL